MDDERVQLPSAEHIFNAPSWISLAESQHGSLPTPTTVLEAASGTVFAFHDRLCFTKPLDRRVYVVRGEEEVVYLFHEDGTVLDEPDAGTAGGVQR